MQQLLSQPAWTCASLEPDRPYAAAIKQRFILLKMAWCVPCMHVLVILNIIPYSGKTSRGSVFVDGREYWTPRKFPTIQYSAEPRIFFFYGYRVKKTLGQGQQVCHIPQTVYSILHKGVLW